MTPTPTAMAQVPTELLETQVTAELLREGISLKRLGYALKVHGLTNGGYLIELQQLDNGRPVALRKLKQLPDGREAAVAELTVAVAQMLVQVAKTDEGDETQVDRPSTKRPYVHIASDDPRTELFVHQGTAQGYASDGTSVTSVYYSRVCGTPCDRPIERKPGAKYFLSGTGVTASRLFLLPEDQSRIDINVDTGSSTGYSLGYWAIVAGLTAAVTGGVFMSLTAFDEERGIQPWHWGLVGGGLAFGAGGITLMATNRTHYEIQPGDRP